MPMLHAMVLIVAAMLMLWCCGLAVGQESPPSGGLVLWLDASNPQSAVADDRGRILQWKDLSGQQNHLEGPNMADSPRLWPGAMNGRAVARFSGHESVQAARPIRAAKGSGAVLIVWQRSKEQESDEKWQRLVSSRPDEAKHDNEPPNFCLTGDPAGEGTASEPTIVDLEITDAPIGALVLGRTAVGQWHFLRGDIAEVLVYDRAFLSEGQLQEILGYLKTKWTAKVARETDGWTRTGQLGPTPEHVRQDLPLSDQTNAGGWVLDPAFTDEFDGASLDESRWHRNPTAPGDWTGREPALFDPANVRQSAGRLLLDFRKGDTPEMQKHKGYAGYTSSLVQTNGLTGYGYYEVRAKPMNSAGSSSFWFHDTRVDDDRQEIDVFELGGKAKGFERKYNMNAHVWRTPQEQRHWAKGGVWIAPWNFADDSHVFGFHWSPTELRWDVDGVPVRTMDNTHWHLPMRLIFDSEAMWDWFGKVDDADLPSTFEIDYVRVWRQKP